MSNLSDLLPAGAGAKVATLTASGTLPTGQTVVLNSDGTVSAVAETAGGLGTAATFSGGTSVDNIDVTYDATTNKVIAAYRDGSNSNYGTAVVGSVSGSTITWGTPIVFEAAHTLDCALAAGNGQVVIGYSDVGNSWYATVIVGTISGTTITFGTPTVINSSGQAAEGDMMYISPTPDNPTYAHRFIYAYSQNGGRGIIHVLEATSGNGLNNSGQSEIDGSNNAGYLALATSGGTYGSSYKNMLLVWRAYSASGQPTRYIRFSYTPGSPGSLTLGSVNQVGILNTQYINAVYDISATKYLLAYRANNSSNELQVAVGTDSGSEDVTWETPVNISGTTVGDVDIVYDATKQATVMTFTSSTGDNADLGQICNVTISGTTATIGARTAYTSGNATDLGTAYDSTAGGSIVAFREVGVGGRGFISTSTTTNSANFVGITNQAISDSASGEVAVQGGTITNSSLLPQTFTPSVGSEAVFQSSATYYTASVYDPDSGKTIIAWKGTSDYGYAVVATPASDNTITYGTPVAFNSAASNYINIDYDTGQDKVLIVYADGSGSNKVRAIVGTVSGTSISFGSVLEVETNASDYCDVAYSPDSSNHLVVYRDGGNSNYGSAKVLTVSGTSVTAGSKVAFNTSTTFPYHVVYDTSNDKFVIAFRDTTNSSYGTAIVSSVSGTTPSFGTKVAFSSELIYENPLAYDSANGKVVIFYKPASAQSPTAIVGTVSGTSISFGSAVVVDALSSSDFYAITFDSTANKVIVAYRDEDANPDDGIYQLGTVSGTSISFAGKQIFNDASTKSTSLSYNAGVDRTVIAYRDLGNSSYGTGIVLKITSANSNLTIGSTYYVQDDGSLSTTTSSVTAGKALSATTMLLKG